jgi:hypothetical protein
MSKPIVRIEDWEMQGNRLVGKVYNHPNFDDGTQVTTSPVLNNGVGSMETHNTLYQLGKRKARPIDDKVQG